MAAVRVLAALVVTLALASTAAARPFPGTIPLPTGFQPEGIAVGKGHTFFVGSIPTGSIYRGSLRTGQGAVLVPPQPGRNATGIDVDHRNRVFVAGGATGQAYVYSGRTGASLASFQLATGPAPTFVNDVVVTKDAAWFTDSFRPVLYRLAIARNGNLGGVTAVALTGDIVFGPGFNANGIDATPNGKTLLLVQSNTGRLFTVSPATGAARLIQLTGGDVMFGDGILLHGRRLYVVQNQLNRVAMVDLAPNPGSGRIVGHLTNPALDVPTTVARFGSRLYAVNARFGVPDPGSAAFSVVQLPRG